MSFKEIIMAKKAEQEASKKVGQLELQRKNEACIEAFAEFRKAWQEVKDARVPDFRNPREERPEKFMPLQNHLSAFKHQQDLPDITSYEFYNVHGNSGACFYCYWDEDSAQVEFCYRNGWSQDSGPIRMQKQQLLDKFLDFLASKMP